MTTLQRQPIALQKLLTGIQPAAVVGSVVRDISGLAYDSRQVEPGMVFFALPGVEVDGFDYLPQALQRGAVAVVAEQLPEDCVKDIC
ncbi:MAG: hypothetical protein J7K90_13770, partial [Desulfuromusa sp.]|nr:hypothetical protein [Desulfuromusa sp.]